MHGVEQQHISALLALSKRQANPSTAASPGPLTWAHWGQ